MQKKRVAPKQRFPETWTVTDEYKPEGKAELIAGTEFSVTGSSARYKFRQHVVNHKGEEWIEAWGPVTGKGSTKAQFRSFPVNKIKTVHRDTKRR